MDAASRIHVRGGAGIQSGTVGVPCYKGNIVFGSIVCKPLFHMIFPGVIFGGAGGIQNPEMLQGFPQVAHQKTCDAPAGGIPEIGLMSMGQIKALAAAAVFQYQPLVKVKVRKQFLTALCIGAEIRFTDPAGVAGFFLFDIMISVEQIESVLPVEKGKQPKYIIVYFDDLAHSSVFPQFVSVTQLYIGEAVGVVIFQGREIKRLVFQKIVIGAAVPPVAVADQAITPTAV